MADTKVASSEAAKSPATTGAAENNMVIVDLGEQSRKRIRKLRRGEGRLMDKIEDVLADLQEQDVLEASAQTVVVVVRQEFGLNSFLDNDDDDDDDDD